MPFWSEFAERHLLALSPALRNPLFIAAPRFSKKAPVLYLPTGQRYWCCINVNVQIWKCGLFLEIKHCGSCNDKMLTTSWVDLFQALGHPWSKKCGMVWDIAVLMSLTGHDVPPSPKSIGWNRHFTLKQMKRHVISSVFRENSFRERGTASAPYQMKCWRDTCQERWKTQIKDSTFTVIATKPSMCHCQPIAVNEPCSVIFQRQAGR